MVPEANAIGFQDAQDMHGLLAAAGKHRFLEIDDTILGLNFLLDQQRDHA